MREGSAGLVHTGTSLGMNVLLLAPLLLLSWSPQSDPPSPPAVLQSNPLKSLPALAKPHYSWPFPPSYLRNSSVSFIDGFIGDYVRITHSCPLSASSSQIEVETCAFWCLAKASLPSRCIAINFSPWYHFFPGHDPTVTGPPEKAELSYYRNLLTNVSGWLSKASASRVGIGAFLLDQEKFDWSPSVPSAWRSALTRKDDLVTNLSLSFAPAARIERYNRGSVSWSPTYGWVGPEGAPAGLVDKVWGHYSLDEIGETYSCSIYNIRDLYLMRETYRRTVKVAIARNSSGKYAGRTSSVTPWLSLGAGDHLLATFNCSGHEQTYAEPCGKFDFHNAYEPVNSWQLGSEIMNLSRYANKMNPRYPVNESFAPWDRAQVVCLYPSVLDPRAAQQGTSTSMVDHLVAYVRGAAGLDGVRASV
jgi:hypothetical protein